MKKCEEAIENLKENKAAGLNEINEEIILKGGKEVTERLYKLIVTIWNDRNMPEEWKNIIPIFTKTKPDLFKLQMYHHAAKHCLQDPNNDNK